MVRRKGLYTALLLAAALPLCGCASQQVGGLTSQRAHQLASQIDIARTAEAQNQLENARRMYESLHLQEPSNSLVCHRLAIVHARQANYFAAKRYFEEAHRLNPGNAEVLNDLGYACYLNGDYPGAELALRKALELDGQNSRVVNNLALLTGAQGRFEESFELFSRVGREADAHANLANLYLQFGNRKQAAEHYHAAIELDASLHNASPAMLEIARLEQLGQLENVAVPVISVPDSTLVDASQGQTPVALVEPPESTVKATVDETPGPILTVRGREKVIPAPLPDQIVAQSTSSAAGTVAGPAHSEAPLPRLSLDNPPPEMVIEITPANSSAARSAAGYSPQTASAASSTLILPASSTGGTVTTLDGGFSFETSEAHTVVITPAPKSVAGPTQPLASVTDTVKSRVIVASDYVRQCPDAQGQVHELLTRMNSQRSEKMTEALHKLGEMGSDAVAATPAVQFTLKHPDPLVRLHAALALWRIQQTSEQAVPVILESLKDQDPKVRSFAATVLEIGPQEVSAITPLISALSDHSPFVRLHAARALYRYPLHQNVAINVLLSHLTDTTSNVRWMAAFMLGETAPQSELAVSALARSLEDPEPRVRSAAAFALGGLGEIARPVIPEIQRLTQDGQLEVRRAAHEALREIRPPVEPTTANAAPY